MYTLRDEAGNVVRTGRSSNLAAREAVHFNAALGHFEFQVEYRTDVYAEQRGLEQMLYDQFPGRRRLRQLQHDPRDQPAESERSCLHAGRV